jgi:hypothetical protein
MLSPPTYRSSLEGIGRHSNAACAEFPYSCVGVLTAGAFTAQNVSSQSKCRRSWGELSLQWGPAMDDIRPEAVMHGVSMNVRLRLSGRGSVVSCATGDRRHAGERL